MNKSSYDSTVGRALKFASVGMCVNRMDLRTFYIAFDSDTTLVNNVDLFSQISGVITFRETSAMPLSRTTGAASVSV